MHVAMSCEMMCRQAAALVVDMVSFVTSRLKKKRPGLDSEPDPLLYYGRTVQNSMLLEVHVFH